MYFENRTEAGFKLAGELIEKYRYEDCAVVALNDGAVLVGEPIAAELHCVLTMLLIENIEIPGESLTIGGVSQAGTLLIMACFRRVKSKGIVVNFLAILKRKSERLWGGLTGC